MGTRSAIAMKTEDGIRSIYCHWDGYVDHNGRILKEFYSTDEKVKALLDLGDLSSLRQEIGEAHDFDRHYAEPNLEGMFDNWCLAYGRDRGETGVESKTYETVGEWVEKLDMGCEYYYLFNGQDWLVHKYGNMDKNEFPIFDYVEVEILNLITN